MNNEKEKDRALSVLKSFLSQNNLVYEYKNNTEFFREQDSGKIRFFLYEDKQFDQYIFVIISKYTILDKTEERTLKFKHDVENIRRTSGGKEKRHHGCRDDTTRGRGEGEQG